MQVLISFSVLCCFASSFDKPNLPNTDTPNPPMTNCWIWVNSASFLSLVKKKLIVCQLHNAEKSL